MSNDDAAAAAVTTMVEPVAETGVTLFESEFAISAPGAIEEVTAVMANNLAGMDVGQSALPKIKVPTGGGLAFTIPGLMGDSTETSVEVIILTHSMARAYWPGEFAGGGTPPTCKSSDGRNGIGEFGQGSEANPTGKCFSCPMAQWASIAKEGDNRQACKAQEVVFLLRKGSRLPSVINLPPTSIRGLIDLLVKFTDAGVPFQGAIVRMSLVKDQSAGGIDYSKVEWSLVERLTQQQTTAMMGYGAEVRANFADAIVVDAADYAAADVAG